LNPEIVIEGTEWERLVEHPSAGVPKIAVEMVKRRGRGVKGKRRAKSPTRRAWRERASA
jgi:hypothetical protein